MKYALREKDIIVQKATREDSDKKCKAAQKEKDDAVTKMKNAVADKTKFQHLSDSRVSYTNCFITFESRYTYINYFYNCLLWSLMFIIDARNNFSKERSRKMERRS